MSEYQFIQIGLLSLVVAKSIVFFLYAAGVKVPVALVHSGFWGVPSRGLAFFYGFFTAAFSYVLADLFFELPYFDYLGVNAGGRQ